jgi:tetratricopeptide (TPR) repeat protein
VRCAATDASREAAARVTKNAFSDLRTATDFATWAKAKFSQGEFKDAVRAYAEAVRLAPNDAELRLDYAVALFYENRHRPISDIQNQLWAAYKLINPQMDKSLVTRIYDDLMYNLLFDTSNAGYERAIQIGEEYVRNANYPASSKIWLFLACAYGQQYQALKKNDKTAELERIKNRAAECVRQCLKLDESSRALIESLLKGDDEDDDLKGFDDADFRSKVGL